MAASHESEVIAVAAAVDDSYVLPLLVTLRSACRNLSAGFRIDAYVIGYAVSAASRQRLERGLSGCPIRVEWLTLDLEAVRPFWPGLRSKGDITAYYRLYLGDSLPEAVDRVIFLDADLVVGGDLAELWATPFDGKILQAIPDAYYRLIHLRRMANLYSREGAPFSGQAPYFNAGVLLIDLRAWREENVGKKATELVWRNRADLLGRDQDALNFVLRGRWKPLSATWNFHQLPELLIWWETGGVSRAELAEIFRRPKIVHFIGEWKPWNGDRSQAQCDLWRAAAREACVPESRPPRWERVVEWVVRAPHSRLNWAIWRGVVQATMPEEWARGALWLMVCPWMLATYPPWQWIKWRRVSKIRRATDLELAGLAADSGSQRAA
jgi:lipopolysaccharide biosynthesis glycosyltransferase